MKKIIIFILLTVLASAMVFAQSGDARVRGMGGAFTAVADDLNAIYLNPAGLGYLKEKNLVIGLDFNVEMKKRLVFGQEDFPSTWEAGWDPETNEPRYEYYDNFMGTNVAFDPAEYGFDTYDDYMAFYETYGFFSFADNTSNLYFIPHVAYAAKGWGVSTISEIGVDFLTEGGYDGENTPVNVRVTKKQGLMGAVGLGFGPLGIGANLKYYKNSSYSLNYTAGDYREGPPESFFQQIFIGPQDSESVISEPFVELGVGALFTLGTLNLGAYLDNLLFFLVKTEEGTDVDVPGIFDTLSVGAAWTPFDNKLEKKRSALNFIAALDFRNIGSKTERELSAGMEVGLNLGRVIMLNTRAGYAQSLPGELSAAFDNIDLYNGLYTLGFGMKFIIGELNVAFTFPSDMVFDPPMGSLSDERMDTLFGTGIVEMRLSF